MQVRAERTKTVPLDRVIGEERVGKSFVRNLPQIIELLTHLMHQQASLGDVRIQHGNDALVARDAALQLAHAIPRREVASR